jgi:hypothetical protein
MEGLQDLLRAAERKLESERTGVDTSSFEYARVFVWVVLQSRAIACLDMSCACSFLITVVFPHTFSFCYCYSMQNRSNFASSNAYRHIIAELPSPSKAAKKAHHAARNTQTMPLPKQLTSPSANKAAPHTSSSPTSDLYQPQQTLKTPTAAGSSLSFSPMAAGSPTAGGGGSAFNFNVTSSPMGKSQAGLSSPTASLSSPTARRSTAAAAPTDGGAKSTALINKPHRVDPPPEV